MWLVPSLLVGVAFGAGDQLLGSVTTWSWSWQPGGDTRWRRDAKATPRRRRGVQVAGVSAPWLVVPLLMGTTQRRDGRALVVGGVCATSAVLAYVAMILSPMEGVRLTSPVAQISATLASQWPWLAGATIVAPLYGLLGSRWRTRRSPASPVVAVATICLEPLARTVTGRLQPDAIVWAGELACGAVAAVLSATWALSARRRAGQ